MGYWLASMDLSVPSRQGNSLELDLPRFRKRAAVSLDQIAQDTKIGVHFLKAIENEDFSRLPGGIFTTSYLRQYAVAIGYDEDALVSFYQRKMNLEPPSPKGPRTETGSRGFLDRWLRTSTQSIR